MAHPYTEEKFLVAIQALVGRGTQRERLENAYTYNLIHVKPAEMPESVRQEFIDFSDDITRVPGVNNMGAIHATIQAMNDDEVSDMVRRFMTMFWAVQDE